MAPPSGWRIACVLVAVFLLVGLSPPALAQQITYEYDALGRLILMTSPEGVAQWEYDAVGNILRITTRRSADVSGPVAILGVNPTRGAPGTPVTLYGQGFGTTPGENQVAFNGTAATITAATANTLAVTVPTGATTGPISLIAPQGSATSPDPFIVLHALAVTPDQIAVALGASAGFRAFLDGVVTTAVTWRVNGIEGGNPPMGTVTPAGVYTAPMTPSPVEPVTVEAALTADPTQVGTATVRVGQTAGQIAAAPLTVGAAAARSGQTMAGPVTVARTPAVNAEPVSGPVSVAPSPSQSALAATSPISVTNRPIVASLTPGGGALGTVLTFTLTGMNLQEATGIQALRNGVADTTVTASAVAPAPDGTSLTCTLTIGSSAPLGARVLQVVAPQGRSIQYDLATNTFTVYSP